MCLVGVWQREIWARGVCECCVDLRTTLNSTHQGTHTTVAEIHAAKHRLRTQNITRNFSEARLTLPEDGSQRI